MALLMVLLMIATLATIVVSTQERWVHVFGRSSTMQQQLEDKWLLLGAESVLVHHYSTLFSAPVLAPSMTGRQPVLQSDGNTFTVVIRDLQACFNLNSLFYRAERKGRATITETQTSQDAGAPSSRQARTPTSQDAGALSSRQARTSTSQNAEESTLQDADPSDAEKQGKSARPFQEQLFLRLLIITGSDETVAEQVLMQIKENAQISGRMLVDISELRAIKTIDREQWQALTGQLCVLPDNRLRINVNGLQPSQTLLLSALLDLPLSVKEVTKLLAGRPKHGWETLDELKKIDLPEGAGAQIAKTEAYLSLNTEFFELQIERHGRQFYPLRSWVRRSEDNFNVFRRQFGMSD